MESLWQRYKGENGDHRSLTTLDDCSAYLFGQLCGTIVCVLFLSLTVNGLRLTFDLSRMSVTMANESVVSTPAMEL